MPETLTFGHHDFLSAYALEGWDPSRMWSKLERYSGGLKDPDTTITCTFEEFNLAYAECHWQNNQWGIGPNIDIGEWWHNLYRIYIRKQCYEKPKHLNHITTYSHYGREVSVRAGLKGKHRDYCLCYNCQYFHPGTKGNCGIAEDLFRVCCNHGVITPVWACPSFRERDSFSSRGSENVDEDVND